MTRDEMAEVGYRLIAQATCTGFESDGEVTTLHIRVPASAARGLSMRGIGEALQAAAVACAPLFTGEAQG
jgi:hypothetical protein